MNQPIGGNPWLPRRAVIERITAEIPGVATYDLGLAEAGDGGYRFRAGQFNMLYLPGIGEIPISLSADPTQPGPWAHTIRTAGNVTRVLSRLTLGDTLGLRGPFGTAWPMEECAGADVLVVAGGIGLAPLRPAICQLLEERSRFGRLTLLYGAREPAHVLFASQFDHWRSRGMRVDVTVDRAGHDWPGQIGVVTTLVNRLPHWRPGSSVLWCCGPEVMMKYVVRSALDRGLPRERIWLSVERHMQCAVGMCGHCQLGGLVACREGAVCGLAAVEPWWSVEGL